MRSNIMNKVAFIHFISCKELNFIYNYVKKKKKDIHLFYFWVENLDTWK